MLEMGTNTLYIKAVDFYKKAGYEFDMVIDSVNVIPFLTPLYVQKPKVALIFQLTKEVFFRLHPRSLACLSSLFERSIHIKLYCKVPTIVLSRSIKEELLKIGFKKEDIVVAEPGIDPSQYIPGEKTSYPSILYSNRIVPYKNVDDLMKAFKLVLGKVPSARLFVIDFRRRSKYERKLKKLAKELGIKDKVILILLLQEIER